MASAARTRTAAGAAEAESWSPPAGSARGEDSESAPIRWGCRAKSGGKHFLDETEILCYTYFYSRNLTFEALGRLAGEEKKASGLRSLAQSPRLAEDFFIWIRRNPLKSLNSAKGIQGNASLGGTSTAHTKTKATLRRSIAHGKGTSAGSFACQTASSPSGTCALPTSTTAKTIILK
jgi:hypothetical protein